MDRNPFGWDLTDNKTLIALIFWILAVVMNRKKETILYSSGSSCPSAGIFHTSQLVWFRVELFKRTGNPGNNSQLFLKFHLKFLKLSAALKNLPRLLIRKLIEGGCSNTYKN